MRRQGRVVGFKLNNNKNIKSLCSRTLAIQSSGRRPDTRYGIAPDRASIRLAL
jgi:hypothetical protein